MINDSNVKILLNVKALDNLHFSFSTRETYQSYVNVYTSINSCTK